MKKSEKKKPNFFIISSPKVNKLYRVLSSILVGIAIVTLILCVVGLISLYTADDGMDISSLFKGYIPFIEGILGVVLILFMAYLSVVIYNYSANVDRYEQEQKIAESESPLLGAAKDHETQIIEMLTVIAKPLPNKGKLNRARTAQFLRALMELQLIDTNYPPKNLMVWVETVTNYKDGNVSAFNQALKDANPQDTNVLGFQKQIQQVLDK